MPVPEQLGGFATVIQAFYGVAPTITEDAFIAPGAVVIGDVVIGGRSSVWFGCVIRGDVNFIRIGKETNIQDGTIIHVTGGGHSTFVGDGVTVGHQALLHACTIEDHGFVGMQACVMDGAVIESDAMLAAGALLPPGKRIPSGEIWAGRPAKKFRDLGDEGRAEIRRSAARYVALAGRYMSER